MNRLAVDPTFLDQHETRLLSTLNEDGTRKWIRPRLSHGRFLTARRVTAYVLMLIFTAIPFLHVNGRPLMLLDFGSREFTILGFTFLPTDTLLLALFLVTVVVSVILVTALYGRVWCGWACPQTVYMEFLYRPIERLFDGAPGRRVPWGGKAPAVRKALKYAVFLVVSLYLAHTFLAYFVGVEALARWVRQSPFEHPGPFFVMALVTGLMMFDFCYFREQTCIVACPYGRLQSAMHDRNSMIISYDPGRGEPRGKLHRKSHDNGVTALPVVPAPQGDCVDCGLCVITCPTGIDIRDGLQMECIGCAQCIDACDHVMDKLDRPRGLIRYTSRAELEGERKKVLRGRTLLYPGVLAVIATIFVVVFSQKGVADVTVLRGPGIPFATLETGEISNQVRVKITNRTNAPAAYRVRLLDDIPARLIANELPIEVAPGESRTEGLLIAVPRHVFRDGKRDVTLRVDDGGDFSRDLTYRLLGPASP